MSAPPRGLSVVVPVHNGAALVRETLDAILGQALDRPIEVVVVEDHSTDGSLDVVRRYAEHRGVRVLQGTGRGAAAAINAGVRAASHPLIAQIDQDVVIGPGWAQRLVDACADAGVGAAQGYYATDRAAGIAARVMGLDLELRYAGIPGQEMDHVCTGNVVYRAAALHQAGLFDEQLGYGYDNDMSYRLRAAGYRLAFDREARSVHRWREGVAGYLSQQYGFGYGRLDLIAKHPGRVTGDQVSPTGMIAHAAVMTAAAIAAAGAALLAAAGEPWQAAAQMSGVLVGALALERLAAGARAAWRFRDGAALLFPLLHLLRDLAWVAAIVRWLARRTLVRPSIPADSMRPRAACVAPGGSRSGWIQTPAGRALGLVPAHNEAANLPAVVNELRAVRPDLDILVIDDGSDDGTSALLPRLGVRWLRFPERLGIGGAMRAGLRYAARMGYDTAVRLDGDGQHPVSDIESLLAPILEGRADVVLGSRFAAGSVAARGPMQNALARALSVLTGAPVTDPTSGFCAIGPRALRLLAEHHPTGYPEPELRLFLSRNRLSVVEVPVQSRPRLGGTTSLTASRLASAGARVILAMLVVPLRGRVED